MDVRSEFERTEKEVLESIQNELQVIRASIDENAAYIANQAASERTAQDISRVGFRIFCALEGIRNIQENQTDRIVAEIRKLTFAVMVSAAIIVIAILMI